LSFVLRNRLQQTALAEFVFLQLPEYPENLL